MAEPIRRLASDADVDRLVVLYVQAKRRVDALLKQAIAREAKGTAAFRRQQLLALERAIARLHSTSPGLIDKAIRSSYLDGATTVDKILNSSVPFEASAQGRFYGAHEKAAAAMVGQLDKRLALARTTIGRQAKDVFAEVANREVEIGLLAGQTRKEVSAKITGDLLQEGTTAFVDKAGRRWSIDTYAEVAARTATREAVTLGTANRCLELGADLVQISKHINACEICIPFEGNIYSLSGETEGYPRANDLPPFHPRCRHVTTPAPIFDEEGNRLPGTREPQDFTEGEDVPVPEAQPPAAATDRPSVRIPGKSTAKGSVDLSELPAEFRPAVEAQLEAIERVHAFPKDVDFKPRFQAKNLKRGNYGSHAVSYSSLTNEVTGVQIILGKRPMRGVDLEVGGAGDVIVNPTTHELGHFLDSLHFGARSRPVVRAKAIDHLSERIGETAAGKEMLAFKEAVRATKTGQDVKTWGGSYAGSWAEIFARSYEQWIARKGGNQELKDKIAAWVKSEEGERWRSYWPEAEFTPIAEALDALFAKAGLLRK